jgi:CheY-like chemotaxis protein
VERLFEQVFQQAAPVHQADTAAASTEAAKISPTALPLVLIVEDNETNIRTLTDYLLATGHKVEVARNGSAALQVLHDDAPPSRPDIILMDIQMPGIDGLMVIRQIREDAKLRNIPIIALTALAMPGDREKALAAGADEYMSKPVSLKQLVRLMATYLKHAEA